MKYYKLYIDTDNTLETYNKITSLLGVQPLELDKEDKPETAYSLWTYEVEEPYEGPYFDFINKFLDMLEPKFEDLKKLGVQKNHITFWLLYAYDQQCGMGFHPQEMKRLGNSGIVLCIDCWQANTEESTTE